MPHVILIEDDALVRKLLEKRLVAAHWTVTALTDSAGMLERVRTERPDVILLEMSQRQANGFEIVEALHAEGLNTPVIVISGFEIEHLVTKMPEGDTSDIIQKPYDQEELLQRMIQLVAA